MVLILALLVSTNCVSGCYQVELQLRKMKNDVLFELFEV